jgi:hypothetical protein
MAALKTGKAVGNKAGAAQGCSPTGMEMGMAVENPTIKLL